MSEQADVVIVGAGHNGLVAACYLAMGGRRVLVLEGQDRPGGGSRTEERIPGYRFDTHSVAHNIINMTSIPDELGLAAAGLEYREMDPFSIAVHEDGRRVRFSRSIEATVASIAESDKAEAAAYQRFMDLALPIVHTVLPAIRGRVGVKEVLGRVPQVLRVLRTGPLARARDVLSPYDSLLRRWLPSDLTRGPVSAFAAHAAVGPTVPGGALYAFWQAAYHLFGQWHAVGGAQGLTDALVNRATSLGVEVRCTTPVTRIDAAGGRARAVETAGGERIRARAVMTAINPQTALFELLDPPLSGPDGDDLASARRGNVVQALVHIAVDRLPAYADARPGDHNGLQSYVDRLGDLTQAWTDAEAGLLPDPLPLYTFTSSALDDSLAPPGHHTVYLACPAAPSTARAGWDNIRDEFVERAIDTVEARAPGFRTTIQGIAPWTPDLMEADQAWPGGHPMHLDIALDQLGPFRPTRRLAGHSTPIPGLFITGAGTNPAGGIAGTPGKLAAQALLEHR
ncbi:MAG: phytoene desaturase family protein [Acidimicrobiia bacterium]